MKRHPAAYTLIEVLIAAAILLIACAAAAVMALTTVTQEEINARITRCANLQEQAVRLYQLGLDPATVLNILPEDPAKVSLVFTTTPLVITNLGTVMQNNTNTNASCTVEQATCTMVYITTPQSGAWAGGTWTAGESSDTARRTNDIIALRPALR